MMDRQLIRIISMSILAAIVAALGCVNVGEPKVVGPHGQTIAPGHRLEKTTSAMLQQTKRKGSDLVAKIRRALPGESRSQMPEQVVNKDDPTRLDYKPANVGPELYIAGARLAEQSGRYDKAFEQYSLALKTDKQNRNALIGMARLQHRAGNTEAAIGIYLEALVAYRNDSVIMNDLGLCYARHGQLDEAIRVLQEATRLAPDRTLYLNNLVACLVEANRLDAAVGELARVQDAATANFNVGFLLEQAGRKTEAEGFLSQALAIDPNMHQARALLDRIAPRLSSLPPAGPNGIRQVPNAGQRDWGP